MPIGDGTPGKPNLMVQGDGTPGGPNAPSEIALGANLRTCPRARRTKTCHWSWYSGTQDHASISSLRSDATKEKGEVGLAHRGRWGRPHTAKRGRVGTRGRGHRVRISLGEREKGHTEQHTDTRTHTTKTLRLTRRLEHAVKTRCVPLRANGLSC